MAELVYGFLNLADIAESRAVIVKPAQLQSAVLETVASHRAAIDEALNMFTEPTTDIQAKFKGSMPETENQPLDENGRSRKIKGKVDYTVGFPIFSSGAARGVNWLTAQKMTVQQYNDNISILLRGDSNWVRNRVHASIFINTERVVDDANTDEGEITVKPLANGDTVPYAKNGSNVPAVDDHYKYYTAVSDAANPTAAIALELTEHPQNQGEVVLFVPTNWVEPTSSTGFANLTGFIEIGDPLVVPAPSQARLLQSTIDGITLPATAKLRGRVNGCWIVEWPSLPDDYGFAMTTRGPKPLKRREDEEVELRGFKPIAERDDFPYFDEQWIRRMGFGAWNRTAMVVFYINSGASAYVIPTRYQTMRW